MLSLKIRTLLRSLQAGELSAVEICEKCLARAKAVEELNIFITKNESQALASAKAADKSRIPGKTQPKLDGIPVAVKDNFSTAGIRTTCASRMLADYVPPYDATVVAKIKAHGGLLMGKTNLDEFAMGCGTTDGAFGPVRNPWKYKAKTRLKHNSSSHGELQEASTDDNDWFISGGSSGGSAVAVATGAALVGIGSDTGGSTRNPASHCGVVGLKPTYGLVSRHGLIPLVNSMDVPGILTRNVDDAAYMLGLLAGHDPLDSTTVTDHHTPFELPEEPSIEGLTIGLPKEYHAASTQQDVTDAWEDVADRLDRAGAKVIQVSLPHTMYSISCYSVLCACEVASNMARYDGLEYGLRIGEESSTEQLYAESRHAGFNDVVRSRILAGNYFLLRRNYEKYFVHAQKVRRLIAEDFMKVYSQGVDLLLTPTMPTDAFYYPWFAKADNRTRTAEQDICTQPVNMAGLPAITVPTCLSTNGLPIGLQLIGQSFGEKTLLTAAKWIEQEVNFPPLDLSYFNL